MKVWKRIIAIILLLLICGNAMALEETEEFMDFDTQLTGGMDKSTTEWFSTGFNRALLTTCLALDLKLKLGEDFDFYDLLTSPTYVGTGKSDFSLVVIGKNNDAMVIVVYATINNLHQYSVTVFEDYKDDQFESLAQYILSESCAKYYKNDVADIEMCIGLFAAVTKE